MSSSRYLLTPGTPTPTQYHSLRTAANLTPPPLATAAKALANSCYTILIYDTSITLASSSSSTPTPTPPHPIIAMSRIIGDTSHFLQIVDVLVLPAHQKQGLGLRLMEACTEWCDREAPDAYVSLIAERGVEGLYEKVGFRGVEPSRGMYRCERVRRRREGLGIE